MSPKARLELSPEQIQELLGGGNEDDLLLTDEARAAKETATGVAPAPAPVVAEGVPVVPSPAPEPVQPAPAPAAAPVAPSESAGEPVWDEAALASLGRLDGFVEEQVATRLREHQSTVDRSITKMQKEHQDQIKGLQQQLRESQLVGLTDDEKTALTNQWAFNDRKVELEAWSKELEGYDHDLAVARLTMKYEPYGVKEDALADKTIEEMETVCLEAKATYFENLAKTGGVKPVTASQAAPQVEPAPAPAPAPVSPAGATAPSDVGAGTPAPTAPEFKPGQNRDDMLVNLKNLPIDTIATRRA